MCVSYSPYTIYTIDHLLDTIGRYLWALGARMRFRPEPGRNLLSATATETIILAGFLNISHGTFMERLYVQMCREHIVCGNGIGYTYIYICTDLLCFYVGLHIKNLRSYDGSGSSWYPSKHISPSHPQPGSEKPFAQKVQAKSPGAPSRKNTSYD